LAWKLGNASAETLTNLDFHGELDDCDICSQGELKHSKFSRRASYAQELLRGVHSDVMGHSSRGTRDMSRKAFTKTLRFWSYLAAATLELIKEQRTTHALLII
jgi:hypothetical protein